MAGPGALTQLLVDAELDALDVGRESHRPNQALQQNTGNLLGAGFLGVQQHHVLDRENIPLATRQDLDLIADRDGDPL